jgi:menaquinol-cytochrome c reductase iron-sulfur subunit
VAGEDEGQQEEPPENGSSEQHLPTPSILPIGFAIGVAVLLVGLVINWIVVGVGAVIAIIFGLLWAAAATRGETRGRAMPAAPAGPVQTEGAELGAALYSGAEKEVVEEHPERYTRNKFLELSTLGIGAAIGAVVTIPVVGFAVAPAFIGQSDEDVDVGPIENYPEGTFVVTTFESREGGGKVALRTAYIRNNGFVNGVPSFTILSSSCVHLGCPVQPNGPLGEPRDVETDSGKVTQIDVTAAGFSCPCHGGAYDTEGNRTAGPPVRSLDRFYFKIDNGALVLAGRYSVGTVTGTGSDAQIASYPLYDPGEHVDGPEAWLYPYSP